MNTKSGRTLATWSVLLRVSFGIVAIGTIFGGLNALSQRALESPTAAAAAVPSEAGESMEILVPLGPEEIAPVVEPVFEVEIEVPPEAAQITETAT